MDNNAASPFQILDWRILNFDCCNLIVFIPADISHNWRLKAHIENIPVEDNQLRAFLKIEFHFSAKHNGQEMNMNGLCVALCNMNRESVENAEKVFQEVLTHTAMTHCLANLRVFLLQAGTLHQMGSKKTMLPFINLNNFRFDEDVSFSV